ncbi:MAG: DUF429 domain-containing protein [Kamptonema sp. SIO4C4]|nr:DUF429 domain-containing protein [Kamptonema sp. SIO4C4]
MKFLGIDFGWRSGASGLCCLQIEGTKLQLLNCQRQVEIADILAWVDGWMTGDESAMIAVDAPTLIPNETGMRLPDRLTHKYFGRYHAGCYPANLKRPFAERTVQFGLSLQERGFQHAPTITAKKKGRYQIEVFPHPAIVHLFNLERILKYKKGKLADRKLELQKLLTLITTQLPKAEPALGVPLPFSTALTSLKGRELKALEDQVDSLLCAYVAAHWWYWGSERNWVLGDRKTGYIVLPAKMQ